MSTCGQEIPQARGGPWMQYEAGYGEEKLVVRYDFGGMPYCQLPEDHDGEHRFAVDGAITWHQPNRPAGPSHTDPAPREATDG